MVMSVMHLEKLQLKWFLLFCFSLIGGSDYKLIYRHYATLYFVFCVDSSESELGILDLIQVFVETLDKCFENVCELDLIFHVDKVSQKLALNLLPKPSKYLPAYLSTGSLHIKWAGNGRNGAGDEYVWNSDQSRGAKQVREARGKTPQVINFGLSKMILIWGS